MTIHHHPSDETLLRHAAGTLSAGLALVVAVHIEGCAVCRARVGPFRGGRRDAPRRHAAGAACPGCAREGAGAARSRTRRASIARPATATRQAALGIELPQAMRHCEIGPWRWLGPGFKWSKVEIAGSPQAKVMLLKGRAGPAPAGSWPHRHGVHADTFWIAFR